MEVNEEYYIAVMASYNHTVLVYKNLKKKGCKVEFITTPSKISMGCSRAVRFNSKDIDMVRKEIRISKVVCRGIFQRVTFKDKTTYMLV